MSGSADGRAAIGAKDSMVAIVKNDVAGVTAVLVAVNLPDQALRDLVAGGFLPVRRHRIPRDGDESKLAGKLQNIGPSGAEGWTEVADRLARNLGKQIAGAGEFVEHVGRPRAREIRVAPGVVADQVAGVGDAASEFRLGLGELAHHEEGCAHVVLGEDVEQTRRPGRVRAIVEGQGELARRSRSNEGTAEDLRSGPMRGVCKATDAQSGCTSKSEDSVNTRR